MDSLKRAIKYQNIDFVKSVGIFWVVILIVNIASYILNFKFNTGISFGIHDINLDGMPVVSIAGANILPIFIFFIVYCYEMYYQCFPVAIGFSITRKDFYKSAIVNNITAAFVFAVIQGILMKLEVSLISTLSVNPKFDYGIFNTTKDSIVFIIISLFMVFLTLTSILNLVAALNYKYGVKFWIAVGLIFSFSMVFIGVSVIGLFEGLLITRLNYLQLFIIIVTMIITYLIGFVIIANTNVKNKVI
jgi:hypothetical protein